MIDNRRVTIRCDVTDIINDISDYMGEHVGDVNVTDCFNLPKDTICVSMEELVHNLTEYIITEYTHNSEEAFI